MKYVKQPYFLCGFMILLIILSGSFIYSAIKEPSTPSKILYDDSGTIINHAPFEPNEDYPLGSDQDGNNSASPSLCTLHKEAILFWASRPFTPLL